MLVPMRVTVDIPDQYLHELVPEGSDPARMLLEQSVAAAYRDGRIGPRAVGVLLGLAGSLEVTAFLNQHQATGLTVEDLEKDIATLDSLASSGPIGHAA